MKTIIATLIFINGLLISCTPATSTQEDEIIEVATETLTAEELMIQEPTVTDKPLATETPTETPTNTPIACVNLLTPINGAEIPPIGKVTFSWTAMDDAGNYVLNIIFPSGEIVPFETDLAFRDRYMEAFVSGGEYQWQVIVQNANGSEICVSEVFTFDKPSSEKLSGSDGRGSDDGGGAPPPDPGNPTPGT